MNFTEWIRVAVLAIFSGTFTGTLLSPFSLETGLDMVWPAKSPYFAPEFTTLVDTALPAFAGVGLLLYFSKRLNFFTEQKSKQEKKESRELWLKLLLVSLPAEIFRIFFFSQLQKIAVPSMMGIVGILLAVFLRIFIAGKKKKNLSVVRMSEISYRQCCIWAAVYMLTLIPGISGTALLYGTLVLSGLSLTLAVDFAFMAYGLSALLQFLFQIVRYFLSGNGMGLTHLLIFAIGILISCLGSRFLIPKMIPAIRKKGIITETYLYFGISLLFLVISVLR